MKPFSFKFRYFEYLDFKKNACSKFLKNWFLKTLPAPPPPYITPKSYCS